MTANLEAIGWRQGSFVKKEDVAKLIDTRPKILTADSRLLVGTHSCDLAQPEHIESYVEVLVAHPIQTVDGNCTFNKNPRKIHLQISTATQGPPYLHSSITILNLPTPKERLEKRLQSNKTITSQGFM